MPRGVYKRKATLRVKLPPDEWRELKPAEEKTDLVTKINRLINQLINLRNIINGKI